MRYLRPIGLTVLVLWAGFWGWFNIASAFGEGPSVELWHLALGALIVASAAIAWRYPRPGGLVLLGLAAAGFAAFGPEPFLLATLITPPVVAAILLALAPGRPKPTLTLSRPLSPG